MEDKWQNAREQAQAQFESIKEMTEILMGEIFEEARHFEYEDARTQILEDALSVEVRSGWRCIGVPSTNDTYPAEYRILLCTGGPAVQIQGELSEHGKPETARLMMQDWGLPWTGYRPLDPNAQKILLTYARQFYFGE